MNYLEKLHSQTTHCEDESASPLRGRMLPSSMPAGAPHCLLLLQFSFHQNRKRFSGFITVLIYQYLIENTSLILLFHQNSPFPCIKNVSSRAFIESSCTGTTSRQKMVKKKKKKRSQAFHRASCHCFSASWKPTTAISQLPGLRAPCSTRLIGTDQPGLHIF